MRARVSLLFSCVVLLAASRAVADERPPDWSIGIQVGASVVTEGCALLGVEVSRRVWRGLEAGALVRAVLGDMRKQVDGSAELAWRWRLRHLRLGISAALGAGALHGVHGVWAAALLLSPGVGIGYQLGRLELRAGLSMGLYFNRIWVAAWEPSATVAYSF